MDPETPTLIAFIVIGFAALYVGACLVMATVSGAVLGFSSACAFGRPGVVGYIVLWIFAFPVMLVISAVAGFVYGLISD